MSKGEKYIEVRYTESGDKVINEIAIRGDEES